MVTAKVKDIKREWSIPKGHEFRFEVDYSESIMIRLLSGTAEAFGTEMALGKDYHLRGGTKLAIYSYDGARLAVTGQCAVEYVSDETTMHVYLNTHLALETLRTEALSRQSDPPRILVIGSSRTTVSRILLNYAARAGRCPIWVDLDVASGNLMLPGVVAAQTVDRPLPIEEESREVQPNCYFYGSLSPADHPKYYRKVTARLAYAVNGRLAAVAHDGKSGGAIITAPGDVDEEGVGQLVSLFRVSLVLVVGNERLYVTVAKALANQSATTTAAVSVIKLPKSGGVVVKDAGWRREHLHHAFHRYFYGPNQEFSPFTLLLAWDEVQIRRVGEDILAPKSALPLGATRKVDEAKAARVEPTSANLLYTILAVSWASTEDQIYESNIAGFIHVTAVDETKKQITALSICPGKLPRSFLLLGNLKWIEK